MQTIATTFVVCAVMPGAVWAVPNLGFEDGDFSEWTLNPASPVRGVVTSAYATSDPQDGGRIYTAPDGAFFAALQAGGTGAGTFTSILRTFHMDAGDELQGWAAFDARDQVPFNDDALAGIQVLSASSVLYYKNVSAVGDFASSPWESFSYTAPVSGDYTLAFGVRNVGDNLSSSWGLIDFKLVSRVPDAGATWGMLLTGLAGLVWMRRNAKNPASGGV